MWKTFIIAQPQARIFFYRLFCVGFTIALKLYDCSCNCNLGYCVRRVRLGLGLLQCFDNDRIHFFDVVVYQYHHQLLIVQTVVVLVGEGAVGGGRTSAFSFDDLFNKPVWWSKGAVRLFFHDIGLVLIQ